MPKPRLVQVCFVLFLIIVFTFCFSYPELDHIGWTVNNYHKTFKTNLEQDNCPRIDVHKVSPEEFIEKYEKIYRPVVITGVCNEWKANYKWTLDVSGNS